MAVDILRIAMGVLIGFIATGALVGLVYLVREVVSLPVAELPEELRRQLEFFCPRCFSTLTVCRRHPNVPHYGCDCGAEAAPCPACKPEAYDLGELVDELARRREGMPW